MSERNKLTEFDGGVDGFLDTLRPQFLKGVQNMFLHRLVQFMKMRRGRLELNRQPVDLITHLRMQAESAALLAQAKSVGLELDLPDGEAIA